jgi:hypothetical protein
MEKNGTHRRSPASLIALGAAIALGGIIVGSMVVARPARALPPAVFEMTKEQAVALQGAIVEVIRQAPSVWPHSAGDIANAAGRGVDDTEHVATGASITTTTVNMMAAKADVTNDADVLQIFRIVNTHASQHLCVITVDRASGTCADACAAVGAGALTCTGSGAADGTLIPGGSTIPFPFRLKGSECLCGEASAASTTYNITRVARVPN